MAIDHIHWRIVRFMEKINMKYPFNIYHGSPIEIRDTGMKSGTYFSDDIEVAENYGEIIYSFEINENNIGLFEKDIFNEHYISKRLIPFYMFKIIKL
jgi:hypothetical protein